MPSHGPRRLPPSKLIHSCNACRLRPASAPLQTSSTWWARSWLTWPTPALHRPCSANFSWPQKKHAASNWASTRTARKEVRRTQSLAAEAGRQAGPRRNIRPRSRARLRHARSAQQTGDCGTRTRRGRRHTSPHQDSTQGVAPPSPRNHAQLPPIDRAPLAPTNRPSGTSLILSASKQCFSERLHT